jgi:hypothetical protein
MKCRNAKKLVFDFIDGLDNDKDRLELEQHLSQCPECDKLASQLARSMDLLHRTPQEKTSENFAWKFRLKLNQERNAVRGRYVSHSTLFRSWNLRYVATAVSAFAVVLTVGLLAVKSEIFVVPTVDRGADSSIDIAETPDAADAGGREGLTVADNQTNVGNVEEPARVSVETTNPGVRPPRLRFNLRNRSTVPRLTSQNSPAGIVSAPGPGLIDAPAVLTIAELDSLIGKQLEGMTTEQKIRYLNHSMRIISMRLLQTDPGYGRDQR